MELIAIKANCAFYVAERLLVRLPAAIQRY